MIHIKLTENFDDFEKFCREIISYKPNVIGLDTETIKQVNDEIFGIDIIQFCMEVTSFDSIQKEYYRSSKIDGNRQYISYVFRMCDHYQYALPPSIRTILESKNIIKVGCDIMTDLKRMKQIYDFNDKGFIDNQYIAISQGNIDYSLNSLSLKYLGIGKVKKNMDDYILYAAWDAYLSLCTYLGLTGQYDKYRKNDIKTINIETEEIDKLIDHLIIKTTLFNNKTTTKTKLINTINTCYPVWTKKYDKVEINYMIEYSLHYWQNNGLINIDGENITLNNNNSNNNNTDNMKEKLLKNIPEKGMKKQSMINYISNSFYFNYTTENKFTKSSEFIKKLIENGTLKKINGLKYVINKNLTYPQ